MVRGYEVAKGQYMIVEDEEIEAVQTALEDTIKIRSRAPDIRSAAAASGSSVLRQDFERIAIPPATAVS